MNKIKKVIVKFNLFIVGMLSKVFSYDMYNMPIESMYAVKDPVLSIGEKVSRIGKITVPIILFAIGLFVILSKKITKKAKSIIVLVLLTIGIFAIIIMNYIANNF